MNWIILLLAFCKSCALSVLLGIGVAQVLTNRPAV
jgi:hypothetical protein